MIEDYWETEHVNGGIFYLIRKTVELVCLLVDDARPSSLATKKRNIRELREKAWGLLFLRLGVKTSIRLF